MDRLQFLADGLKDINVSFIERPNFEMPEYEVMVLYYLLKQVLFLEKPGEGQDIELKAEYPAGKYFGVLNLKEGIIAFSPRGVEVFPNT